MKKTKIIIPALGMLLLSTAASVTGTVAWFSANNSVSATGMTVAAKSDGVFLEIAGAADSGTYSDIGTSNVNAQLYPVAHEPWSAKADIEDFDLNDDSTNDNWYFRYSGSSTAATQAMTAKTYIGTFTDYVATTSFSVQLHAGTTATGYDLFVSSMTIPANKGIHVVVAGSTGYQEFSSGDGSAIAFNNANVISDEVSTTPHDVKVYIFFAGNDANVYSDNIANLTGAISFTLDVFTEDHA